MDMSNIMTKLRNLLLWIILLQIHTSSANTWNQYRSEVVKKILKKAMNDFWEWKLQVSPEFASATGIHTYDASIEEFSEANFAQRKHNATEFMRIINSLDRAHLSKNDEISLEVMNDMLATYIDGYKYRKMTSYIPMRTGVGSIVKSWIRVMKSTKSDNEAGLRNLIARYNAIPRQVDNMINLTKQAIDSGFAWTQTILKPYTVPVGDAQIELLWDLLRPLREMPKSIDNRTRNDLFVKAEFAISFNFVAAINKLNDFVDTVYAKAARKEIGISALKDGHALYEACLRWHLSVKMTAQEVHNLGHKEVERILKRIQKIKNDEGFRGDVNEYMGHIMNNSANTYKSKEEILQHIHKLIQEIKTKMPRLLHVVPSEPIVVEEQPSAMGPPGSYKESTLDRKTATYYANTYKPETVARFSTLPVVLHETQPGHHVQAAYKKSLDIPKFRQFADYYNTYNTPFHWPFYTAYMEGWGMYAEFLGEELGLYKDPHALLGRLSGEMLRACRLVVDTGIHAFGWTQEEAEEYINKHTALSRTMIHSEVTRYISWPGQACAYKIGELRIKKLRTHCETVLGNKFDLREFHHQVLSLGPVPLPVLEKTINNWVNEQNTAAHTAGALSAGMRISPSISLNLFYVSIAIIIGTVSGS